jgi:hypothetical protein
MGVGSEMAKVESEMAKVESRKWKVESGKTSSPSQLSTFAIPLSHLPSLGTGFAGLGDIGVIGSEGRGGRSFDAGEEVVVVTDVAGFVVDAGGQD